MSRAPSWDRVGVMLTALTASAGGLLCLLAAIAQSREPLHPEALRALLGWAIPVALVGLLGAIGLLLALVRWLLGGRWRHGALAVAALLLFLVGFAWAGVGTPGFVWVT